MTAPSYEALARVLKDALAQASSGKGHERHSSGEPYEEQKIVRLNEQIGTNHGAVFQACKKSIESCRLPYPQSRNELLGAINYLAAAVIVLDRSQGK